jgi:hypothetical protein
MTQTLQLSPEITKLQEDIVVLEKELGKVILERDEMLNTVKPNLKANYPLFKRLIGSVISSPYKTRI